MDDSARVVRTLPERELAYGAVSRDDSGSSWTSALWRPSMARTSGSTGATELTAAEGSSPMSRRNEAIDSDSLGARQPPEFGLRMISSVARAYPPKGMARARGACPRALEQLSTTLARVLHDVEPEVESLSNTAGLGPRVVEVHVPQPSNSPLASYRSPGAPNGMSVPSGPV
jgi:hypothetical protein